MGLYLVKEKSSWWNLSPIYFINNTISFPEVSLKSLPSTYYAWSHPRFCHSHAGSYPHLQSPLSRKLTPIHPFLGQDSTISKNIPSKQRLWTHCCLGLPGAFLSYCARYPASWRSVCVSVCPIRSAVRIVSYSTHWHQRPACPEHCLSVNSGDGDDLHAYRTTVRADTRHRAKHIFTPSLLILAGRRMTTIPLWQMSRLWHREIKKLSMLPSWWAGPPTHSQEASDLRVCTSAVIQYWILYSQSKQNQLQHQDSYKEVMLKYIISLRLDIMIFY